MEKEDLGHLVTTSIFDPDGVTDTRFMLVAEKTNKKVRENICDCASLTIRQQKVLILQRKEVVKCCLKLPQAIVNSFNRSQLSIFIHECIIFHHIHLLHPFLYPYPPTRSNPQTGAVLTSGPPVLKKRHFCVFKISIHISTFPCIHVLKPKLVHFPPFFSFP
jgi:hypothetical protein